MKKSVIILPFSLMDGFTYKENVDIPFTSISTAYLGKANRCMCGCSGNYKYTSQHAKWSGKNRGYKVHPEEISDRAVRGRLKKIMEIPGEFEILDDYIFTKYYGENEDRQVSIYLKKG